VRADSMRDRWFTPEEALEYGMVDHIVSQVEDVRPAVVGRMAGLAAPSAGRGAGL
ncbi:MAG: ATP-dependent Clp protease proteolytic subunit, partial [Actinobacteria bacterium]|nr:ATP-dependent Clp protease proteolytic subunit [Actinomycetota bacterium]